MSPALLRRGLLAPSAVVIGPGLVELRGFTFVSASGNSSLCILVIGARRWNAPGPAPAAHPQPSALAREQVRESKA